MNVLDYLFIILYIIFGFVSVFYSRNMLVKEDEEWLKKLLFYHLLIGIFFYYFTSGQEVDSYTYWTIAKKIKVNNFGDLFNYSLGTNVIYLLNYIPSNIFEMTYFQGTLLYSFLGFLGIKYLYLSIENIFKGNVAVKKSKLYPLILFLPNFHFWSSGIGKDTIAFFCICYAIYSISVKRHLKIILPTILLYLVRPHILFFLLISFVIAFLFDYKVKGYKKMLALILFAGVIVVLAPKVASYIDIESFDVKSLENYTKDRSESLSRDHTGSRIDTSSYPIYYKVFTFLFRPLFFDATNFMAIIISFENLFLLLIVLKVFRNKVRRVIRSAPYLIKGLLIFCFISALGFSLILGNLGIMVRMKNMLMPSFIIFTLWFLSNQTKKKKFNER